MLDIRKQYNEQTLSYDRIVLVTVLSDISFFKYELDNIRSEIKRRQLDERFLPFF